MEKLYIGLMSGTSLDGVDGVLVDFGPEAAPMRVLAHQHRPFAPDLAAELLALNSSGADELQRAALAGNAIARVYSACVEGLLSASGVARERVVAIGAHGQTVRHRPGEFDGIGFTTQLNAPALLAEMTGVSVIADFRSRDVAAGGQGAPLVPAFHRAIFGRENKTVAVLNLGGIANLTVIDGNGSTTGFDCGPANALMDHWVRLHRGLSFDSDGNWAATGAVHPALLAQLLAEPYFDRDPPKSTGRDLFNPPWLDQRLQGIDGGRRLRPEDVQATLAELSAQTCAAAIRRCANEADEVLVAGGGSLNAHLMDRLATNLPGHRVVATDAKGLPGMQVEACAFAWLACAWVERRGGNLSQVTGAIGPRILGALYPAG